MIIAIKNYFRNKMVNLTAQSVTHFIPKCNVYCFSLYKNTEDEYATEEPLLPYITQLYCKTKYINNTGKLQDHIDETQTAGYAHPDNVKYFTEGFNIIQQYFFQKNINDKVLILAEDHFFTTGAVLNELTSHDFDLAYAAWDGADELDANGGILCIKPVTLSELFPLSEEPGQIIEHRLSSCLIRKVSPERRYKIKNRKQINYFGDGLYTNSSVKIKEELIKAGILET
jgi:hypothetical protein